MLLGLLISCPLTFLIISVFAFGCIIIYALCSCILNLHPDILHSAITFRLMCTTNFFFTVRASRRRCLRSHDARLSSTFPFDPGPSPLTLSQAVSNIAYAEPDYADGDIIVDTGAGKGIKPTDTGLVNPVPTSARIMWGDGTTTQSNVEASLPNHDLPPFLVAKKASNTLVSVGSNVFGTTDCYSFFEKHNFRIKGLQIFVNSAGELDARLVGSSKDRVKYISSMPQPGGVYKAPDFDVFKNGETGAWRFDCPAPGKINVVAGPSTPTNYAVGAARSSATVTPSSCTAERVNNVFAGHADTKCSLIAKTLTQPDFVEAFEYTIDDLNAHQQQMVQR